MREKRCPHCGCTLIVVKGKCNGCGRPVERQGVTGTAVQQQHEEGTRRW